MKAILDRLDALLNFGVIIGVAVLIAVCSFAFGQIVADKTTPRPVCKCAIHSTPISVDSLKAP